MKEGWQVKTLGEIGDIYNGNSINAKLKKEKYVNVEEGYPYIGTKDIYYDHHVEYENGVRIPFSSANAFKIAPINSVFVCSEGGSAGRKIAYTDREVCFGNKLLSLTTSQDVFPKFVFYFYQSKTFKDEFKKRLRGIIGGVSINRFKGINISLPVLSEQKRIVAILDKTFDAIEKAKANAEENLKNSKELFESYLNNIFVNKGWDWEEKTFGEVAVYDKNQNGHIDLPYVGLEHIESDSGKFLGNLDPQEVKSSTFYFNEKHVLYGRLRPYLNKVLLPNFKGHCSTEIFPIKVKDGITREFLFYWLLSGFIVKKIDATSTGARMPRANMNQVLEFDFAYPTIKEQEAIVQKLDSLRIKTQEFKRIYQNKLVDLEELKKSLLQKAFNGEL